MIVRPKFYKCLLTFICCYVIACNYAGSPNLPKEKKDARSFMNSIATEVSTKGPSAWLFIFENNPDFFMASDGKLVFENYDSAKNFINNFLIKNITKISLQWNHANVQFLTDSFTQLRAGFHEDITNAKDSISRYDGYFTALAHYTNEGWKIRNVHWSIIKD